MTVEPTDLPPHLQAVQTQLRELALRYPETREEFPWDHSAFKVRGKTFLFLAVHREGVGLTVKLPRSSAFALDYPFTEPTGYGLGRSGWVTARFAAEDEIPLDTLIAWIDESFRAVAPKKLSAAL